MGELNKNKYITLFAGEADFSLADKYRGAGYTFVSTNAYAASCLQDGTVIGYKEGDAVIEVYEDRTLNEKKATCNVIVLPGENKKFPLYVNRWNGIPKNAVPEDLIEVHRGTKNYNIGKSIFLCKKAADAYDKLAEAANSEGVFLKITYAYRNYDEQEKLVKESIRKKGEREALKLAAPAGFSEHHTGLAIDVSGAVNSKGKPITSNDKAYRWLNDNCYKYGFMIKNLKDKQHVTGTSYEPWHIRYIGDSDITKILHEYNLTLDEYIYMKSRQNDGNIIDTDSISEYEYTCLAAKKSVRSGKDVFEFMKVAKEKYNIPFEHAYKTNLYKFSEKACIGISEKYTKETDDNDKYYQLIEEKTGMDRGRINENIAVINENPYAQIDLSQYAQLAMYDMSDDELEDILIAVQRRRLLSKQITAEFKRIDSGKGSINMVNQLISEYYSVTDKTLLDSDYDEFMETIEKCEPQLLEDKENLRATVVDMLVCKRLMGFWPFEYFMFKLRDKSTQKRREYVSNIDRTLKLNKVNDRISSEFLDNKYLTYKVMKEFYKRELVMIDSMDDYDRFKDFVSCHKKFVKKPVNGSMGSGIGLVEIGNDDNVKEVLQNLLDDVGSFTAEELIVPHGCLKQLNPDSVNTIRLTTYNDNGEVHILWPWVKVGRAGSFVDNSGAGGMGVAIDKDTGKLMSDGMDEHGSSFPKHPDNGTVFRGYLIEGWDKAIEFGKTISTALSERISGIDFVGWDITYTEDEEWVIVEGNAFPQLVQQATYGRGFKAELNEIIK